MDKELFKKLVTEHPLTAEEALRLDSALEGENSRMTEVAMSLITEEAPSLAWRSSLNQRLIKASRGRRSRVVWRFGAAATAVAAAATLIVITLTPVPSDEPKKNSVSVAGNSEPTLEDEIMTDYHETMQQASLGVQPMFEEPGS